MTEFAETEAKYPPVLSWSAEDDAQNAYLEQVRSNIFQKILYFEDK
jgi:hypothetical protein